MGPKFATEEGQDSTPSDAVTDDERLGAVESQRAESSKDAVVHGRPVTCQSVHRLRFVLVVAFVLRFYLTFFIILVCLQPVDLRTRSARGEKVSSTS